MTTAADVIYAWFTESHGMQPTISSHLVSFAKSKNIIINVDEANDTICKQRNNALQPKSFNNNNEIKSNDHESDSSNSYNIEINTNKCQKPQIDYELFKSSHIECNKRSPIIKNCNALQRVINALNYYQTLNVKENMDKFIEFCENVYYGIIDDYVHLITQHSNDLFQIRKSLICDNSQCKYKKGICLRRIDQTPHNNASKLCSVYLNIFDNIHFYLIHSDFVSLQPQQDSDNNTMKQVQTPKSHISKGSQRFLINFGAGLDEDKSNIDSGQIQLSALDLYILAV